MTHRDRFETAFRFQEPDRVPIELKIAPAVREMPVAERLVELMDEHATNVAGVGGPDFGFFGLPGEYHEEVIEDRPGEYRRMRRVWETDGAGTFTALTYHPEGIVDYHWEKRFISTADDLARLADAPRAPAPWDHERYKERVAEVGEGGFPLLGLWHPLGNLVRNATHEEVYAWFYSEKALMHRFLETAADQIAATIEAMSFDEGESFCFGVTAHEMLIPPWMGHNLFDEYIVPYDTRVNHLIRQRGGRVRAHCHGNCMEFLEKFVEMGIDATEPLEGSPPGDIDLGEAKRRVGDRLMLSGNICSQEFIHIGPEEVRQQVQDAIRAAAPGGGFSLRTTGGHAGTGTSMPEASLKHLLENCEAYLLAGLEFGEYPIRV
jgi:uroporphyrinogen decarboxylase-like protein